MSCMRRITIVPSAISFMSASVISFVIPSMEVNGKETTHSKVRQWYEHPKYQRFWAYYRAMMPMVKDPKSTNMFIPPLPVKISPWPKRPRSRLRNRIHQKRRRKKKRKKAKEQMSDSESLQAQICSSMVIEDDEDIDDDFLAFIAKGQEHREEWKEYKAQQMGNSVFEVKPSSGSKVDKVHPDIVRREEMGKIYGVASPQIHAMETAMQLSFERISVNETPALWPNIPINIMF
ncbi:gem-associated protein 8-like isoform X2 [Oratosquilla oratoria]|uniref:gem-associated protein 8-like isoform X2 n=1 Tax=Oratosquilla oratoria TaxID=337810 RepID=UPI003F774226